MYADHNSKFDENGRKFSKPVENAVGAIFLFPTCFQNTCNADTLKSGLVWERVKQLTRTDKINVVNLRLCDYSVSIMGHIDISNHFL